METLFERHGLRDISTESMDELMATEPWDAFDTGYYLVSGKAP